MDNNLEKYLENLPTIVTLEKTKIIVDQIEKCICKIYNKGIDGTGFFCYIDDENNKKKIPVMITNRHIINEDYFNTHKTIKISFNNEKKNMEIQLDSKRIKYLSPEKDKSEDITIIEIKKEDNIKTFLEIDEKIYENNSDKIFNQKTSYIIQYPKQKGASVSYGLIKISDDCKDITHYCSTDVGSSGSPIINLESSKVIGIHIGASGNFKFNKGNFLKFPIKKFLKIYNGNNMDINNEIDNKADNINKKDNKDYKIDNKNEITITLKIEQADVNKEIYFLDNTNKYIEKNKSPHGYLSELNNDNTELFIDENKVNYQKYFVPPYEGNFEIKLKFNTFLKDCSYMFYYCQNIIKIDFSCFKSHNITNMNNMFCYCTKLSELNLSSFNTENVTNMSYMFSYCTNLEKIVLSSFNTKNVIDMKNMFLLCNKLSYIDISSFVASPKLNNDLMFDRCRNIKHINLKKNFKDIFLKDMDIRGIEIEYL